MSVAGLSINSLIALVLVLITAAGGFAALRILLVKSRKGTDEKADNKAAKNKLEGYDSASLNDILGYDFIQVRSLEKAVTAEPKPKMKKSYAESVGVDASSHVDETKIGVTGAGNQDVTDEPDETPEERDARLAMQARKIAEKKREQEERKLLETGTILTAEESKAYFETQNWPMDYESQEDYEEKENRAIWMFQGINEKNMDIIDHEEAEDNDLADTPKEPELYDEAILMSQQLDEYVDNHELNQEQSEFLSKYEGVSDKDEKPQ